MKEKLGTPHLIRILACILVMILSIAVISPMASKPESYKGTIAELNEKEHTVMMVTATTTAASVGIGAIPGDATTPVANKIMDLAGYLVMVLCAIVMEKYLLTMAGYLVFQWLIPIVCVLIIINTFIKSSMVSKIITKILVLSLVSILVVPLSVRISNLIEKTNKVSIEMTLEEDGISTTSIEEAETASEEIEEEKEAEEQVSSGGFLSRLATAVGNAKDTAKDIADSAVDTAKNISSAAAALTDEAIDKAKDTFWDLVETVVALIVINCIIPILVLMFLLWAVNMVLGLQINLPDPSKLRSRMHKKKND